MKFHTIDPADIVCKYYKTCELFKPCPTCHDEIEASTYCGKHRELDRKK
jgi:uncharacterized CHY-type Zn-finger protein